MNKKSIYIKTSITYQNTRWWLFGWYPPVYSEIPLNARALQIYNAVIAHCVCRHKWSNKRLDKMCSVYDQSRSIISKTKDIWLSGHIDTYRRFLHCHRCRCRRRCCSAICNSVDHQSMRLCCSKADRYRVTLDRSHRCTDSMPPGRRGRLSFVCI